MLILSIDPESTDPAKWSTTLKQFISCCQQIVRVYLAIFGGLVLKEFNYFFCQELIKSSRNFILIFDFCKTQMFN